MINSFAPGVELATLLCFIGWSVVSFLNYRNKLYWFTAGSIMSAFGYAIAIVQYYEVFWVDKLQENDIAMELLFVRMVCHVTVVIIFIYKYRDMPSLRFNK